MHYSPDAIRTIALLGHAGCGKTTLAETLLHKGAPCMPCGSVERAPRSATSTRSSANTTTPHLRSSPRRFPQHPHLPGRHPRLPRFLRSRHRRFASGAKPRPSSSMRRPASK
ncbi:ATP-binding cassette domain-containing protein [Cupriavidus basilensis]